MTSVVPDSMRYADSRFEESDYPLATLGKPSGRYRAEGVPDHKLDMTPRREVGRHVLRMIDLNH